MFIDRFLAALRQAASLPTAIFRNECAVALFHNESDGSVEFAFQIVAATAPLSPRRTREPVRRNKGDARRVGCLCSREPVRFPIKWNAG